MVSSGLDAEHLSNRPNSTPRVSQYRLAAHLGAALILYVGMMHTAFAAKQEWRLAHPKGGVVVKEVIESLTRRNVFRRAAWGLTALVLLTAVSGKLPSFSSLERTCNRDEFESRHANDTDASSSSSFSLSSSRSAPLLRRCLRRRSRCWTHLQRVPQHGRRNRSSYV